MEIKTTQDGAKTTVSVTGRVDTTTAPQLEHGLSKLDGVRELVVDISGVPYMSSAGLRCLLSAQKMMMAAGGEMSVAGTQPAVREVFDITGFSDILTLV